MSIRQFLSGSSSAVVNTVPAVSRVKEEPKTVRLVTRMHLASPRPSLARFCVVGVRADGREGLIGLAFTRSEAKERMRAEAARWSAVRLRRWVGSIRAGRWQTLAVWARDQGRPARRRSRLACPVNPGN